jgi:agmatine deiminase
MHPDIQVRNPNFQSRLRLFYLGITNGFGWVMVVKAMTRTDTSTIYAVFIEDTIVTIIETNTEDSNYLPLQDNPKAFTKLNWKTGVSIIVALPMPQRVDFESKITELRQFPYLNKCVLVPTFNDPNDRKP